MDQERRVHLLAMVTNTAKAHKEWVEHGDAALLPEDDLYQRFQELADQSRVIFAPRAEDLEKLILAFAPHWSAFVTSQQTTADITMLPGPELWEAWENLHRHTLLQTMPRLKRIESIKQLLEEKVPRRQMCMIYGFTQPDGSPDFEKLEEEIETPGKHTGQGWVAPVNRELAAKIQQLEIEAESVSRKRQAKIAAAVTPAKESIESLVASGVSARQVAQMKRTSVDYVSEYCRQHGLPQPPLDYSPTLLGPGMHDPVVSAERQAAMDRLGVTTSPQQAPHADDMPAPSLTDAQAEHYQPPTGPAGPAGDEPADVPALPSGIDLDSLPEEEANQIQEAAAYFSQGMDAKQIATAMNIHPNKSKALLKKAGFEPANT